MKGAHSVFACRFFVAQGRSFCRFALVNVLAHCAIGRSVGPSQSATAFERSWRICAQPCSATIAADEHVAIVQRSTINALVDILANAAIRFRGGPSIVALAAKRPFLLFAGRTFLAATIVHHAAFFHVNAHTAGPCPSIVTLARVRTFCIRAGGFLIARQAAEIFAFVHIGANRPISGIARPARAPGRCAAYSKIGALSITVHARRSTRLSIAYESIVAFAFKGSEFFNAIRIIVALVDPWICAFLQISTFTTGGWGKARPALAGICQRAFIHCYTFCKRAKCV